MKLTADLKMNFHFNISFYYYLACERCFLVLIEMWLDFWWILERILCWKELREGCFRFLAIAFIFQVWVSTQFQKPSILKKEIPFRKVFDLKHFRENIADSNFRLIRQFTVKNRLIFHSSVSCRLLQESINTSICFSSNF